MKEHSNIQSGSLWHRFRMNMIMTNGLSGLMLMMIFGLSLVVLTIPEDSGRFERLVEGQDVPRTLFSEINFSYKNYKKLSEDKLKQAESFPKYYRTDDARTNRIRQSFHVWVNEIQRRISMQDQGFRYAAMENANGQQQEIYLYVKAFNKNLIDHLKGIFFDENSKNGFGMQLKTLIDSGIFTTEQYNSFKNSARIIVVDSGRREYDPIAASDVCTPEKAAKKIAHGLLRYYNDQDKEIQTDVLEKIFTKFFNEGNVSFFEELSKERLNVEMQKLEEAAEVIPFRKWSMLFKKGDKLTKDDVEFYEFYCKKAKADRESKKNWVVYTERICLTLIFMLFSVIYISHIHPEVVQSNRSIWILGIIAMLALGGNWVCGHYFRIFSSQNNIPPQYIYLFLPLGFSALTICSIYGLRSAIYVGLYVTGITSLGLDNSFQTVVTGLMVSGIAGFSVRHTSDYKKFFMCGFFACFLTTLLTSLIFQAEEFDWHSEEVYQQSLSILQNLFTLSLAGASFTTIGSLVTLFVLESLPGLDISTRMSYLTYTDRNHPLLKQLQLEAPGTYHHSERVASLAEKAALEVGCNPQKVQACALFHDVGKLSNPEMFTENAAGINVMAGVPPQKCAEMIRNHVIYGLELAHRYKLKKTIRDAIATHHGTDFISFFYDQAKKESADPVDENDYRYPGPLPEDKELVILTLADCSEAAVRSLQNPSAEKIAKMVHELFLKKMERGQLAHANLNMKDISLIEKSIVESLVNMGHPRIVYPGFLTEAGVQKNG